MTRSDRTRPQPHGFPLPPPTPRASTRKASSPALSEPSPSPSGSSSWMSSTDGRSTQPTVLGTALFGRAHRGRVVRHAAGLDGHGADVHVGPRAHLRRDRRRGGRACLAMAERDPNIGFGVLLLFVVFEFRVHGDGDALRGAGVEGADLAGRAGGESPGGRRDGRLLLAPSSGARGQP